VSTATGLSGPGSVPFCSRCVSCTLGGFFPPFFFFFFSQISPRRGRFQSGSTWRLTSAWRHQGVRGCRSHPPTTTALDHLSGFPWAAGTSMPACRCLAIAALTSPPLRVVARVRCQPRSVSGCGLTWPTTTFCMCMPCSPFPRRWALALARDGGCPNKISSAPIAASCKPLELAARVPLSRMRLLAGPDRTAVNSRELRSSFSRATAERREAASLDSVNAPPSCCRWCGAAGKVFASLLGERLDAPVRFLSLRVFTPRSSCRCCCRPSP